MPVSAVVYHIATVVVAIRGAASMRKPTLVRSMRRQRLTRDTIYGIHQDSNGHFSPHVVYSQLHIREKWPIATNQKFTYAIPKHRGWTRAFSKRMARRLHDGYLNSEVANGIYFSADRWRGYA